MGECHCNCNQRLDEFTLNRSLDRERSAKKIIPQSESKFDKINENLNLEDVETNNYISFLNKAKENMISKVETFVNEPLITEEIEEEKEQVEEEKNEEFKIEEEGIGQKQILGDKDVADSSNTNLIRNDEKSEEKIIDINNLKPLDMQSINGEDNSESRKQTLEQNFVSNNEKLVYLIPRKIQNEFSISSHKKIEYNPNAILPFIVIENKHYNKIVSLLKSENIYFQQENELIKFILDKDSIKNYPPINYPLKIEEKFLAEVRNDLKIFTDIEENEICSRLKENDLFKNNFEENIKILIKSVFNTIEKYITSQLNSDFIYYGKESKNPSIFYIQTEKIVMPLEQECKNFWNIIYAGDEDKSLNIIHDEISFIENEIDCHLLVTNIKEQILLILNLIKMQNELLNNNNNDKKIKLNLIIKIDMIKEMFDFMEKNKKFENIDKIFVIYDDENETDFQEEYKNKIEKTFKNKIEMINYFKNTQSNSLPMNINNLITLEKYNKKFILYHEKIAKYYNDKITNTDFNKYFSQFSQFLNSKNSLEPEKIQNFLKIIKLAFSKKDNNEKYESIINAFYNSENSLLLEFNKFLYEINPHTYDSIAFFVSEIIRSFNENKNKLLSNKKKVYKYFKLSLAELLQYKQNEGNIITFPEFLVTNEDESKTMVESGIKEISNRQILARQNKNIYNVYVKINYNWNKESIPISFLYKNESIFLPFSFFRIKNVAIDMNKNISIISLTAMNKKLIFENYLTNKSEIIYNNSLNTVTLKETKNILIHCIDKKEINELKENCSFLDQLINGNFFITNTEEYFELIMKNIRNENKKFKELKVKFELILFDSSAKDILSIIKKNHYRKYFNSIIIMTGDEKKYEKYINEGWIKIFNNKIGLIKFLNKKYENHFLSIKNNELITIDDFNHNFSLLYKYIAKKYNELKTKEINSEKYKNIINSYLKNDSILNTYSNQNLVKIEPYILEKIAYSVAEFILCLNEYGKVEQKSLIGEKTLYKSMLLPFNDILLYKQNEGKVISHLSPVFVYKTENDWIEEFKKKDEFNVVFKFHYKCDNTPIAFDISEFSEYIDIEFLLLPLSFYKINNVFIDNNNKKAEIELEIINKINNIEKDLIENDLIIYNHKNEIIETTSNLFAVYKIKKNQKYIRIFGKDFVETNKDNISLLINGKEVNLSEYYNFNKNGENVIEIIFKSPINDISYMFANCDSLFSIQCQNNILKNITNTSNMFEGCNSLEYIDALKYLDVSNVKEMSKMFLDCSTLKSLKPLKYWDMENVENLSDMFSGCYSIDSIDDLKNWNLVNAKNISDMFGYCFSLKSVDALKNWNMKNVSNSSFMFYNCSSLSEINFLSLENVTNCSNMFSCCTSLKYIDALNNWKMKTAKDISYMFSGCSSLLSIDSLKNWNMKNAVDISGMFLGCSLLKNIESLKYWNINSIRSTFDMFSGCTSLSSIDPLKNWIWSVNKITNMSNMFAGCSSLNSLEALRFWNVKYVINTSSMFSGCSEIKNLEPLNKWNVSNLEDCSDMFSHCVLLKNINALKNWEMKNVKNTSNMFLDCISLNDISALKNWKMSNVLAASAMFAGCTSLENINCLKNWNIKGEIDVTGMFADCTKIKNVDVLVNWDLTNAKETSEMFYGCSPDIISENIKNDDSPNGVKLYQILRDSIIEDEKEEEVEKMIYDPKIIKTVEYFIENMNWDWSINIFGKNFVEKNKDDVYLVIDGYQTELIKNYTFKKSGKTLIEIIEINELTDLQSMFEDCSSLTSIDALNNWNMSKITNTSRMFAGCINLVSIDALKNWNMENVKDVTDMFIGCNSLNSNSFKVLKKWNLERFGGIEKISNMYIRVKEDDCEKNN